MKDNYKAQDLKFYARNEEEAKQFQERAFELGYRWTVYGKTLSHLTDAFFYLDKFGALFSGNRLESFIKDGFKQITLAEFLAPQRGEMVEVRDSDFEQWEVQEFVFNLGDDYDYPYLAKDKPSDRRVEFWEQMRPIKNEQPKQESLGMFKAFDETIELLEQAIDGLKKCKDDNRL